MRSSFGSLTAAILFPAIAVAQSTSTGMSGLGEMRTPDTIQEWGSEITLIPGRYSSFEAGGATATRLAPSIAYTQGIGSRLEAGLLVPFFMHTFEEESDSGLANLPVGVKYRFLEASVFRFAVDANVEVPVSSKDDGYGSGSVGYGVDLLGSVDAYPVVLSGSLGYGTSDYCPRCTMPGNALLEPESLSFARGAIGVSMATTRGLGAFVEVHGTNAYMSVDSGRAPGDADLYAIAGGRIPLGRRFTVTAYGGAGLVPDDSNTQAVGALLLHYAFSGNRTLARSLRRPGASTITSGDTVTCSNGHTMSASANFCPVCGAKRASAVAAATPKPVATPRPTPVAVATPRPMATPAPTPAVVAMATPTPVPVATPAPVVRKPLTAPQAALKAKMTPQASFLLDGVAFTAPTGALLAPAASQPLADLAAVLESHPEARVRIEAHMDPTDKNPVPVSQQRADAVVAKLVSLGASPSQLEAKGLGGTKSLFPSFVEAMKMKNRRVELAVIAPPSAAPAVVAATPAATPAAVVKARVKVLASKGRSAQAVKLANALKQNGTRITTIANVPEARAQTLIYFTAPFRADAQALAKQIPVKGGAKLTRYKSLGAGVDIVIVVGSDVK